ncbi:MAG: hypothetical protein AMS24_00325 [Chlamydiae bacterium SM23_39]|nr:MAG: hypothetical protein AMS24_00325 [Chlamydiae bacterium SM23_39]
MINSEVSKMESNLQQALYEIIYLQNDSSRINADTRNNLNDVLDKQLKRLRNSVSEREKINRVTGWILAIGIPIGMLFGIISFCNPAALLGEGLFAALLNTGIILINGLYQICAGGVRITAAGYKMDVINNREKVGETMALEHYITDKNEDNDAKNKNSFEALAIFMKVFNQMIAIFGNAVQKN